MRNTIPIVSVMFEGGAAICLNILHCIIYVLHCPMSFAFDRIHPPSLVGVRKRFLTTTTTTHLRTAEQVTPEWSIDYEVRFGLCTADLSSLTAACSGHLSLLHARCGLPAHHSVLRFVEQLATTPRWYAIHQI